MCGIAGIAKFDPRESVEEPRLARMRDVIAHRGPDGEGLFVDGAIGLAHRRLAIIDPAAGLQPMSNEEGTVWIAYNGEIYNHRLLRPWLAARGHHFRTRCDTETILQLYEEAGDQLVDHLHGMFAFAIWDRRRRRLLLARDRLGIKPLYFACTSTEMLFGSEIKAILAAGTLHAALNDEVLPSLLSSGYLSGEETLFRGVRRLMPGHVLTWSADDGPRQRRYWSLPEPQETPLTFSALAASLRARLEAAVERHLMSDVPLGVFLSGGLDSSVLAAMVARATAGPVQTFAVGFSEREANELPYARQVARHIGAIHNDVTVSPEEFFAALPRLIWHEDEPIAFPSSVPLYFVARLASEHVKVVLTGEGADELFLGYNRYRVTQWNARLGQAWWALAPRGLRDRVRTLLDAVPMRLGRLMRRSFLAREPGIRELHLENFAVFPETMQRQLLIRHSLIDRHDPHLHGLRALGGGAGTLLDQLSRLDLQTYLHELLMKQDQMSMAASIESRVPFLDDDLVELVTTMPARVKVRGWQSKAVLRAAARDLVPAAILQRPKMGFPVPVGRWLRANFQPLLREFVLGPRPQSRRLFNHTSLRQMVNEHTSGRAAHGDRLWLLINLEIWLRIFHDGDDPDSIITERLYANPVGKNGRPLAADDGRTRPQLPHRVGALAPSPRHAGHHARLG
jgi:asparagine synthase (glutamine-hydrolysing)